VPWLGAQQVILKQAYTEDELTQKAQLRGLQHDRKALWNRLVVERYLMSHFELMLWPDAALIRLALSVQMSEASLQQNTQLWIHELVVRLASLPAEQWYQRMNSVLHSTGPNFV
jgi:hypothetical protein